MKYRKIWADDNTVDISRKSRVCRNNKLISKAYKQFSPQDLCFETEEFEANASVNKESYRCSNYFEDSVDKKSSLLNKCGNKHSGSNLRDKCGDIFGLFGDYDFSTSIDMDDDIDLD